MKAIIFDFDGVILDSVNVKTLAFRQLYAKYGKKVQKSVEKYHLENGGISRFEKFKYFHKQFLNIDLNDTQINALAKKFSKLVFRKVCESPFIPGALEFLKYASEKNVEIFYISNRYSEQLDATVNNLKKLGFPDAKKSNVLLRSDSRSKSDRRKSVYKDYEVIMLLGDNLADFNDDFEEKISEERTKLTDNLSNDFGTKLIVLPNPNYGDWESNGLFGGKSFDNVQKDSVRRSQIKSY